MRSLFLIARVQRNIIFSIECFAKICIVQFLLIVTMTRLMFFKLKYINMIFYDMVFIILYTLQLLIHFSHKF